MPLASVTRPSGFYRPMAQWPFWAENLEFPKGTQQRVFKTLGKNMLLKSFECVRRCKMIDKKLHRALLTSIHVYH